MRFRPLGETKSKYLTPKGQKPALYNTVMLLTDSDKVAVCEGEFDTIVATLCGMPAVGVPGAQIWYDHYPNLFEGFNKIYICGDGDDAGAEFNTKWVTNLPNAEAITLPEGEDLNSIFLKEGKEGIKNLWT